MNDKQFIRRVTSWPFLAAVFAGLVVGYFGDIIAGRRIGTIAGGIVCYSVWVIGAKVYSRRAARELEGLKRKWDVHQ
jgi:hypothetical protein